MQARDERVLVSGKLGVVRVAVRDREASVSRIVVTVVAEYSAKLACQKRTGSDEAMSRRCGKRRSKRKRIKTLTRGWRRGGLEVSASGESGFSESRSLLY